MLKLELRKIFLEKQKSLLQSERNRKSEQITRFLFNDFDFSDKRFVNCFVTLEKNNELDTSQLFQMLWSKFSDVTTTAPRVNFATNMLENARVTPQSKFVENKWRILEPVGDEIVDPDKLDAVLVPLIAFDRQGYRVGYGKGFYDKFLATCRPDCQKIGLSFFPPVEKIDDVGSFDVRLDFCVTPERVWQFC